MEHFLILFIAAIICSAGGTGLMACLVSNLSKKANRIIVIISAVLIIVGATGLVSIHCAVNNADIAKTETSVYTISKLTTSTIFFEVDDDVKSWSLNDNSYICVEEATEEYSNVVVKITNDKHVDWMIDFETQSVKYVVYLEPDIYERYKSPNILYEKGEM